MHVHFLSPVVNYHFSKNRSCHFFTWASNCKHTSVLIVGHHPTDGKKSWSGNQAPGSRRRLKVGLLDSAMAPWLVTRWSLPSWLGICQTSPVINQLGRKFFIAMGIPVITTKWGCLLFGLPGLPYQSTNIVGSRNLLNAEWLRLEVPVRFRMTQPNSSLTSWMLLETSRPMAGRDQTCVCYGWIEPEETSVDGHVKTTKLW
jgi:hypothetical protein